MSQRYVVAEVSKSWIDGTPIDKKSPLVSKALEEFCDYWSKRGYRLHSFRLSRVATDRHLNETIIAVFELEDHKETS